MVADLDSLSHGELKALVVELLGRLAELERTVAAQGEEIRRLKGLKGRPQVKPPSGMEKATEPRRPDAAGGGGDKQSEPPKRVIHEQKVVKAEVPTGSRFKGYEDFVVHDVVLRAHTICYRRERWVTLDGRTIVAALPEGIVGHYGSELRRLVLSLYHQGQMTVPRLLAQLHAIGISISKRQLVRLLIAGQEKFCEEARAVLRAGLQTASWIAADDTGARHKGSNGACTQIGNAHFAWFGTTASKSRLDFLDLLRAGHVDYVINDAALAYLREQNFPEAFVTLLAEHPDRHFADVGAWHTHIERLGITALAKVARGPICLATEAALWGSVKQHGLLPDTVILSDDAGRFNVGLHALCWVHAERLVHKLDTFTPEHQAAQQQVRGQIWRLYKLLKGYRRHPTPRRKALLEPYFDTIFLNRRTGFVILDRLLARLHKNKAELLRVLERPELPLHTNGAESDIRCQVIRRKISGGTRSDAGRDCRDAFLSLAKTAAKLGFTFWDYLGARLALPGHRNLPDLPTLVRHRCATA